MATFAISELAVNYQSNNKVRLNATLRAMAMTRTGKVHLMNQTTYLLRHDHALAALHNKNHYPGFLN